MAGGWVAFTVREPHKERLAGRWLANAGFECLLPEETHKRRRRHGDRSWHTATRLALPGYVFVRVTPPARPADVIASARQRVATLGRPVGMAGKPLVILDGWQEALLLDPEGLDVPAYMPSPGDPVQLTGVAGLMEGYRGMVDAVTSRQARVIIEALHRAMVITVPIHALRLAA